MIDIHTHIMPFIDDGSSSIEMSLNMLNQELNQGIHDIILTPHVIKNQIDKKKYLDSYRYLNNIIKTNNLDINFYLAGEIFLNEYTYDALINKEIPTISNSSNVFIELPLTESYSYDEIYNMIFKLNQRYNVILCHPERYYYLRIEDIYKLTRICKMQVNTSSIIGNDGLYIKRRAFQILRNDLAYYIASDCHNDTDLKPNLLECYEIIEKKFSKQLADKLIKDNPLELLQDVKRKWI